jgi:hypothetical protein
MHFKPITLYICGKQGVAYQGVKIVLKINIIIAILIVTLE